MKEIAAVLEVTESRVSQIHSQAVLRLRGRLKSFMAGGRVSQARILIVDDSHAMRRSVAETVERFGARPWSRRATPSTRSGGSRRTRSRSTSSRATSRCRE